MLSYKNYEISLDLKDYEFDGLGKNIKIKLYQTINAVNPSVTNLFGEIEGKKDYFVVAVKNDYGFYIEVFNYKTDTVVDFTIIGELATVEGTTTFDIWEGEEYISKMIDFSLNRILKIQSIKESNVRIEVIENEQKSLEKSYDEADTTLIKKMLLNKLFNFNELDYFAQMKTVQENIFTDFYAAMIYLYINFYKDFNLITNNLKIKKLIKMVRNSNNAKLARKFLNYLNNIPFNELYSLYQQIEKDIKKSNPFDFYDTNIEEFIVNMTNLGIID